MADATHDELWNVRHRSLQDYRPHGKHERDGSDCSCGCAFYHRLDGPRGFDWGVCFNPESYRCGLLTFEHQGCPNFVYKRATPNTGTSVPNEGT